MKKEATVSAFEAKYIDVGQAISLKGPRAILKIVLASSEVKAPPISIDWQCAKSLAAALLEFVAYTDATNWPN